MVSTIVSKQEVNIIGQHYQYRQTNFNDIDKPQIPNKNNTLFDKPPIQKTQKNKQPCWQAYLTLNTKRPTTLLTNLKFLTKTIPFLTNLQSKKHKKTNSPVGKPI
jgi:hypothetical protein